MKKTILLLILVFTTTIFFVGCGDKKKEPKEEEPFVFVENDFKTSMLNSFETKASLEFEGRFVVGYMYSESFSTDEIGTLSNGNIQLTGRAIDPSDIGDETVVDGRTYSKSTNSTGDLDLVLPNGNSITDFYQRYFIPLEYDWNLYDYEEIDPEKGRILIDEKVLRNEVINGRNGFVHQYTYIEFTGDKSEGIIKSGSINRIIIRSYIDISSYMNQILDYDFGNKFMIADQINQTLGEKFTEGILSIEEFVVEFK